jgi:hypothetical protein
MYFALLFDFTMCRAGDSDQSTEESGHCAIKSSRKLITRVTDFRDFILRISLKSSGDATIDSWDDAEIQRHAPLSAACLADVSNRSTGSVMAPRRNDRAPAFSSFRSNTVGCPCRPGVFRSVFAVSPERKFGKFRSRRCRTRAGWMCTDECMNSEGFIGSMLGAKWIGQYV